MENQHRIGFIGLGNLGLPIAQNLIDSGHRVFVYNRTADKIAALTGPNFTICDSIASLARQANIVFSIVSDDAALLHISIGESGLMENSRPGSIHVSMSTILPATAQALSDQYLHANQNYLAAPVFGRPEAAKARKLNFLMSGPQPVKAIVEVLLRDGGAVAVFDFGESIQAANTVKLCGNFLIASALEAMGEAIALCRSAGVDSRQMWNMLTQTLFSNPIYVNYGNIILEKRFLPASFTAKLGLKDINLVLEQAERVGEPMPLARLLKNNLSQLVEAGDEQMDWSAMHLGGRNDST